MSAFIRIVQWDKHQHYKDRNPPWIKLHRDLMTSETWVSSSNEDRVLAIACMMLAAASGNLIPANPRYIQRVAYLDFTPDFSALIGLGFIEYVQEQLVTGDASKVQASARPEKETDTDTEKDSVANATGAAAPPSAVDLKKMVFDSGVPLLTSTGSSERNARSMIGRWCSEHGDGQVLSVLALATANAPADPIPWIRTRLESRNGQPSARTRSLTDIIAEADAEECAARH